jgi:hypothetical protein
MFEPELELHIYIWQWCYRQFYLSKIPVLRGSIRLFGRSKSPFRWSNARVDEWSNITGVNDDFGLHTGIFSFLYAQSQIGNVFVYSPLTFARYLRYGFWGMWSLSSQFWVILRQARGRPFQDWDSIRHLGSHQSTFQALLWIQSWFHLKTSDGCHPHFGHRRVRPSICVCQISRINTVWPIGWLLVHLACRMGNSSFNREQAGKAVICCTWSSHIINNMFFLLENMTEETMHGGLPWNRTKYQWPSRLRRLRKSLPTIDNSSVSAVASTRFV